MSDSEHEVGYMIEMRKKFGNIFEAYRITTYECWRNNKKNEPQEIVIKIFDAGPANHHTRFQVVATDKATGQSATGNASENLNTALAIVHWGELG
jgi:hypothetical protein